MKPAKVWFPTLELLRSNLQSWQDIYVYIQLAVCHLAVVWLSRYLGVIQVCFNVTLLSPELTTQY
jgi:hypothetical protein